MSIKSIILAATTLALSTGTSAALVSTDWNTVGDNLITQDTSSGLDWLDLTETRNLSYNIVASQLVSGGQFDGWRYATNAEVETLWLNFGIDLSVIPFAISPGVDANIVQASEILGNTTGVFNSNALPNGTLGLTADGSDPCCGRWVLGAYNYAITIESFYLGEGYQENGLDAREGHVGSYLVQASVVPIPAAAWLFGSGLLGLIGIARRRKVCE